VGNDKTRFYFWRVGTWEEGPQALVTCASPLAQTVFSPDGRLLAVDRGDGAVRLIETASGRELAVLEDPQQGRLSYATFSPDGTQLLVTVGDQTVLRLWDLRRLRAGLQALDLDWDAPAYPPEDRARAVTDLRRPLEVEIIERESGK
jgi:WD40 repeat protein